MRGEGRQRWEGEHRREKGRRKEIRSGRGEGSRGGGDKEVIQWAYPCGVCQG